MLHHLKIHHAESYTVHTRQIQPRHRFIPWMMHPVITRHQGNLSSCGPTMRVESNCSTYGFSNSATPILTTPQAKVNNADSYR
ncbi:hypothetical protein EVA_03934 [gut metagenome]|uniref:Uncharacterized protein n=1 Tax=gut metagenome TaxID=749906 RepID=J9D5G5_9ZZZZ